MSAFDLLGTSQAFRSDLFNLNYSKKQVTQSDIPASDTPIQKNNKIDFESVLKTTMSPYERHDGTNLDIRNLAQIASSKGMGQKGGVQINSEVHDMLRHNNATRSESSHISPELVRSSYQMSSTVTE
jgi:flagellar basal body rod protein FlgB